MKKLMLAGLFLFQLASCRTPQNTESNASDLEKGPSNKDEIAKKVKFVGHQISFKVDLEIPPGKTSGHTVVQVDGWHPQCKITLKVVDTESIRSNEPLILKKSIKHDISDVAVSMKKKVLLVTLGVANKVFVDYTGNSLAIDRANFGIELELYNPVDSRDFHYVDGLFERHGALISNEPNALQEARDILVKNCKANID